MGCSRSADSRGVSSRCQSLISQPLPLVERIGKRITFLIEGSLLERQPAQDGGKDEDARTDLGWSAQLDVDLVLVHENLALFRHLRRRFRR